MQNWFLSLCDLFWLVDLKHRDLITKSPEAKLANQHFLRSGSIFRPRCGALRLGAGILSLFAAWRQCLSSFGVSLGSRCVVLGGRCVGVTRILAVLCLQNCLACLATRVTHHSQDHARRLGRLGGSVGLRCCVRAGFLSVFLLARVGALARFASFEVHLGGQRMSIGGSRVLTGGLNMGGSETAATEPSSSSCGRGLVEGTARHCRVSLVGTFCQNREPRAMVENNFIISGAVNA
ncbi:hypothetical protein [Methylobacterium sp. 1030]|uniref:hypothetical protein n=1 Tax=Methylobacterium sp. 1030 TaxID=3156404 RepID=UPI003391195D